MRKPQRELRKWKALAIFLLLLFVYLVVSDGATIKKLEARVATIEASSKAREEKLQQSQEQIKQLNKDLEQAKREKADAEAKAISRQRTLEQSNGYRAVQLLGACNYRTRTATGFDQADTQLVSQEINRVFGDKARLAKAVFTSESGLRSNACSTSNDWGISQVNRTAHPQYSIEFLMDYRNNVQAAWAISSGGTNFNPWSDFKNGNYLKHL